MRSAIKIDNQIQQKTPQCTLRYIGSQCVSRKVTNENRPYGAKKAGRQVNALYLYKRSLKLEYG